MPLTLNRIPGFADLPKLSLLAHQPALGIYLAKIANNATFGMVRCEVFVGLYQNGQTVGLPVSSVDGYRYQRSELLYMWGVQSSLNNDTGWISGPDSLWYGGWNINQATGAVSSVEWYRRSGSEHPNPNQSNDGSLQVYCIAQRQFTNLVIADQQNSYTDIADSALGTDKALTQSLLRQLNNNAKFAAVDGEVIYMGDFQNGQTVPVAVSPVDGYSYPRAQTKLMACWRWTCTGGSFTQPPNSNGQLGPQIWSINSSTGVVTITIKMIDNNGTLQTISGYGRVAVFAFCSRHNLVTLPGIANSFAEIAVDTTFVSGSTLRTATMLQINNNIREAVSSPEFFGPTDYTNGNTVPLPTGADGYVYTRAECSYLYEWADTTPASGSNLRVIGWAGKVDQNTGAVQTTVWRLPPGGPVVIGSGGNEVLRVLTIATRGAHAQSTSAASGNAPSDIGSVIADNNPPTTAPFLVVFDAGDLQCPSGSTVFFELNITDDVIGLTFPASLASPTSIWKARVAPAGTYTITIKKNGSSIGTINFAASTTATFTFSSTVSFAAGDVLQLVAPSSADGSGYYGTLAGTRTA